MFAANKQFWLLMIIYPISWAITGAAMLVSYFVISRKAFKKAAEDSGDGREPDCSVPAASVAASETASAAE